MKRYRVYYQCQTEDLNCPIENSEVISAYNAQLAARALKFKLLNDHPGPAKITIGRI